MEIFYQNNYGQKIDFMESPYAIFESDFLDFSWDYESSYNAGMFGGRISSFYRKVAKFSMGLAISASSEAEYNQARNYFLEVTEKDILNLTPGRLHVGDSYLTCYLYASKKSEWEHMGCFMINKVKVATEYPAWCKDVKTTYSQNTSGSNEDDYPYDYPYDYLSVFEQSTLLNSHYAPCALRLYMYGPCENPSVFIGGHLYQINTSVSDGEYLFVDGREKEIYLYRQDGSRESMFNARNKDSDVFQNIAPGSHAVTWNGDFWFDAVLTEERSEPEWTT